MPKAYAYRRVSSLEQVENTSLEEQERRARAVAMARGLEIERVFTDPAVSGTKPLKDRPAGAALLALLQPDDYLIAARLDRLFRNAADALTTLDSLKARGVKLVIEQFGSDPVTENGSGRLVFNILAAVADWDRENIVDKLLGGRANKQRAGGFIGGKRPFGYRVEGEGRHAELIPVPQEQAALQLIGDLIREGLPLRRITEEVEKRLGVRVSHETVRKLRKAQ